MYDVVVIGSGFGGGMTALSLARVFKQRNKGETVHILERGSWWTTPVGTVQDKEVQAYQTLAEKKQPVQYWSSHNGFKGVIDLLTRCVRGPGNEDGLYEFTTFGEKGLLGLKKVMGSVCFEPAGLAVDRWSTPISPSSRLILF
jgi:choline dehydrogenase-like flavoprotein